MFDISMIDGSWSLFLDRDGVINDDKSPYTLNAGQFDFYDGVPEAITSLGKVFRYIFVVTNQRGVGRQLMTEEDLSGIHKKMIAGIADAGGKIDKIYYCTAVDNDHPNRKPNPGMALQAMKEYPDIDPKKSIVVGNNFTDMQFGKNAGFHTVLVHNTGTRVELPHPVVDAQFETLPDFADAVIRSFRQ